jgi:hypothetical protein
MTGQTHQRVQHRQQPFFQLEYMQDRSRTAEKCVVMAHQRARALQLFAVKLDACQEVGQAPD